MAEWEAAECLATLGIQPQEGNLPAQQPEQVIPAHTCARKAIGHAAYTCVGCMRHLEVPWLSRVNVLLAAWAISSALPRPSRQVTWSYWLLQHCPYSKWNQLTLIRKYECSLGSHWPAHFELWPVVASAQHVGDLTASPVCAVLLCVADDHPLQFSR